MRTFELDINLESITTHQDLVSVLTKTFLAEPGDKVRMKINLTHGSKMLFSDLLTLIASAIFHLRKNEVDVEGVVVCDANDRRVQYASRIDFFKHLGVEYKESFNRSASTGRFVEITPYNGDNFKEVNDKICKVVIANASVAIEVQQMLDYCLSEIMDNVLNHAAYPAVYKGEGCCCAQLFPSKNEIRLIICDTGVGIHTTLTSPPESQFKNMDEKDALSRCVEYGVTNGGGLGFGLYATSEFIKHNNGEMIVYSGNHFCRVTNGRVSVSEGDFWQGTFVYMRINTKNIVDYKQIMPEGHTLPDDYEFMLGQRFGVNDDLW
jgi:hypothetical protein